VKAVTGSLIARLVIVLLLLLHVQSYLSFSLPSQRNLVARLQLSQKEKPSIHVLHGSTLVTEITNGEQLQERMDTNVGSVMVRWNMSYFLMKRWHYSLFPSVPN